MRLTDEQEDFRSAIQDFCQRECGTRERREALTNGDKAHSEVLYRQMADLGWLGVSIPEEYGGSGGGLVEQCILFEEVFHGMAPVAAAGPTHTVAGCYRRFGRPSGSPLSAIIPLTACRLGSTARPDSPSPQAVIEHQTSCGCVRATSS